MPARLNLVLADKALVSFEQRIRRNFQNAKALECILSAKVDLTRRNMMAEKGLRELYIDELKDLYNAETQLVKALPKMAKAAASQELRAGFEEHLEQTKGHVQRLETIFNQLDESPKGKKCKGMEGLIEEGSEVMEEGYEDALLDAALIGAAQRVEHYEMAGYGTVIAFAEELGEHEHTSLLTNTLKEEKETDEKLSQLAKQINTKANDSRKDAEVGDGAANKKRGGRAA
jgi:ferritin-like metal-binding protein YciE